MDFPIPETPLNLPNDVRDTYRQLIAERPTKEEYDRLPRLLISIQQTNLMPEIRRPPHKLHKRYPKLRVCNSLITGKTMLIGTFEHHIGNKMESNIHRKVPLMEVITTYDKQPYDPMEILKDSIRKSTSNSKTKETQILQTTVEKPPSENETSEDEGPMENIIHTTQFLNPSCITDPELRQILEDTQLDF